MSYNDKDYRLEDEDYLFDDDLEKEEVDEESDYYNDDEEDDEYDDVPLDNDEPLDEDLDNDEDLDDDEDLDNENVDGEGLDDDPDDLKINPLVISAAAAAATVKPTTTPAGKPIFKIKRDDEGGDFFNSDEEPEVKPKEKPVKLDPEDPDYWIEERSEIGEILPNPFRSWKVWLSIAGITALLLLGGWLWFLRPHTDQAVKYGYLKHMERRGTLVKTFEGVLIPYREIGDKTPTYFEEVRFSVKSDSLAALMKTMMLQGVPVRLEYEEYNAALPWIGDERMVIVGADTADADKILPPEYR